MAQLKIKLVKSLVGRKDDQIATAESLGATKGKIAKISHLVEVTNA